MEKVNKLNDKDIWEIASKIEAVQPQWGLRLSNELNVFEFAYELLKKAQENNG